MADRKAVFNGVKLMIEKICGERALLHYDLFAISKVLLMGDDATLIKSSKGI